MENQISSNWYMVLIKGIIMVLLAAMILYNPEEALVAYSVYIGIGLIVAGLAVIARGFSLRKVSDNWGWSILEGFLDLFIGYVILSNPENTALILPFIFGFWAVFYGVYLIINSAAGTGNGWMSVLAGILLMIGGYFIMFNPGFAGISMAVWVAILLLIAGIYNVIMSFSLKQ